MQGFLCSTWHQLRSFGSCQLDASLAWGIQEGFALMPGTSVGMVGSWPLWQADHCLADHAELPREGVAAASPLRHGATSQEGISSPNPTGQGSHGACSGSRGEEGGRHLWMETGQGVGGGLEPAVSES